jgi:hypothetical protein
MRQVARVVAYGKRIGSTPIDPFEIPVPPVFASPEQCRKIIVGEIKKEIRRLKAYQKNWSSITTERMQIEIVSRSIPEARELERFVRYEAHLSREFDRTLNQLHRMQDKRLGHPAPPRIELEFK